MARARRILMDLVHQVIERHNASLDAFEEFEPPFLWRTPCRVGRIDRARASSTAPALLIHPNGAPKVYIATSGFGE